MTRHLNKLGLVEWLLAWKVIRASIFEAEVLKLIQANASEVMEPQAKVPETFDIAVPQIRDFERSNGR